MTKYGFTGTRNLHDGIMPVLDWLTTTIAYDPDNEYTTGCCTGFDEVAALHLLLRHPEATHRLILPANRSQISKHVLDAFTCPPKSDTGPRIIIAMPGNTDYRDRNNRILDYTDHLMICAEYPEDDPASRRSGTWMTKRLWDSRPGDRNRSLYHITSSSRETT